MIQNLEVGQTVSYKLPSGQSRWCEITQIGLENGEWYFLANDNSKSGVWGYVSQIILVLDKELVSQ
jgi:hypothetical protein